MMTMKQINVLRDQARNETCPQVDVTNEVMALLCSSESVQVTLMQRPLAWCAAIAATVAVSVSTLAIIQYYATDYPLIEVANSISWVIQ